MLLLQPKDTFCDQARDVAGYESGLPYQSGREKTITLSILPNKIILSMSGCLRQISKGPCGKKKPFSRRCCRQKVYFAIST